MCEWAVWNRVIGRAVDSGRAWVLLLTVLVGSSLPVGNLSLIQLLICKIGVIMYILHVWRYCIYLFLERGEGKGKKRERNINQLPFTCPQPGTWPTTQACAPTGNRTGNLLVRRLVLNPLSHTSPGDTFKILGTVLNL